ncbi:MAG: ATP-binding protein [Xanthomonadales bacterium]|nr:ATP-binding protein [Xanthomonadales bacterium]
MDSVTASDTYSSLDALMKAAVDAIIIIDDSGVVQRFNRAAQLMFGYQEDEVLNRNVKLLMPDLQAAGHDGHLKRYRESGQTAVIGRGREELGRRKNGEIFPMHLSVGEIDHHDQWRFVGIIKDLSEVRSAEAQVRKLEDQLLHADRLVILGELTAGIAHEINQPLTAIAAYADAGRHLLERRDDISREEMYSICERIAQQARRAGEVVQRLRKLVRSGTVSKARHDINQIIKNTIYLFEYEFKKNSIELDYKTLGGLPELYVDEVQVQQILVNLIKNALDAIAAAGRDDGRVTVRIRAFGPAVEIAVSDNGPGVPEALRDRLFEPFFTTKPKGVGLGLSICKNIAGAHGGSLRYSQGELGGGCFTLTLPLESIG